MEERKPLWVLRGTVVHGYGRGRTVGMPTANLLPERGSALPPAGVYAVEVWTEGGRYVGVTNVGTRPTVDSDSRPTVETLVLNFSGDLYGREMTVAFYRLLRPIQRFPSLQAVRDQVERDSRAALALLGPEKTENQGGEEARPC